MDSQTLHKPRRSEELEAIRWHISELQTLVTELSRAETTQESDRVGPDVKSIDEELAQQPAGESVQPASSQTAFEPTLQDGAIVADAVITNESPRSQTATLVERAIRSSEDGIIVFNREGVCISWNTGMEHLFGISAEEAVGKDAAAAFPFLVEAGKGQEFARTLQGEPIIVRDRAYSVPVTGGKGYYEGRFSPAYGGHGEIIGGMAIFRDSGEAMSGEGTLQSDSERYRELFENAFDMMFTHDLTGKLTSVNKAAERMTGYTRAEALEINTSHLFTPDSQREATRIIEGQLGGETPRTCEIDLMAKDGRCLSLEVSFRLIYREGKAVGVQGIARDTGERKKAEEQLAQAHRKLETWVNELEQRTREMTLLSEMGDLLRACLTEEEVYRVIARVAQELFPTEVGAIYVISPLHDSVETAVMWGNPELIKRIFVPGECWALRRGRIHWVEDTHVGMVCKHLNHPPPDSYLCVPMMARSEALGILFLTEAKTSRLTDAKRRLAVSMAEHVAMALSNLKLHETLRTQSIRDHLTGLFNQSFMQEALELELRRATRSQHPVATIMLDLDGFAALNEAHGVDAGDYVLNCLGPKLQASIRKEDVACRFAGEKFVIILPRGSLEITKQRAENLAEMVRSLEISHRGTVLGRITTSIGVAVYPDHGRTVDDLLRATEAALNRSKKGGGDRVVAAQ
jgi:diguanylate cyclase (GGDEF)-like protein/PAS domain S-box-containing protein